MSIKNLLLNIAFEKKAYKNNPYIVSELTRLKKEANKSFNKDFFNNQINYYDTLLNECTDKKLLRAYNFMINFLVSNR